MRRSATFIAGALLATGAGLTLAGPASAAPSCCGPHGSVTWSNYDRYDQRNIQRNSVSTSTNQNQGNSYSGFNLLSGNSFSSSSSSLTSNLLGGIL